MSTGMQWGEAGSYPEFYERLAVPAFFESFAERLIERARVGEGERVLDVATGTGVVARMIRHRGLPASRVVGFDLTPAMIDVGRAAPGGDEVEWVVGDGQELPFEDDSFDLVLCQQGLQFFPDPVAGAAQMRRVLAHGGRALAACWTAADAVFEQLIDALKGFDADLAAGAAQPFSMTAERLGQIFTDAGFEQVELTQLSGEAVWPSAEQAVRTLMEGTPVALMLAGRDPAEVERLRAQILERAERLTGGGGELRAPMTTHLAVAS